MPELPEVETVCRGLRSRVQGRRISRVEVLESRFRSRLAHFVAQQSKLSED